MDHPTGVDSLLSPDNLTNVSAAPPGFLINHLSAKPLSKQSAHRRWFIWGLLGCASLVVVGAAGWTVQKVRESSARGDSVRDLPLRLVSRVDFQMKLTAAGRVESHQKTVVSCELERMSVSNEGRTISSSGASQVLEVVEEGKQVKAGDILCRLNSSDYEELVRTQQMKTEQARAALEQAQLNFDVAELAVNEYREGLRTQSVQELEGEIALAESDLERASDRLRWTSEMLLKVMFR